MIFFRGVGVIQERLSALEFEGHFETELEGHFTIKSFGCVYFPFARLQRLMQIVILCALFRGALLICGWWSLG